MEEKYELSRNIASNVYFGRAWGMVKFQFQDWLIEVDVEKTKGYYSNRPVLSEACECLYCLNFEKAIGGFPQSVLNFLDSLGIDPCKEVGEITEYGRNENGTHHYNGWYHLVGKILQGPSGDVTDWKDINLLELDGFTFGFFNRVEMLSKDFPRPVIQLDFAANIPWVLSELPFLP